jgi:hypothetical protein
MKRHLIITSALIGLLPVGANAADSATVTVVDCQSMPRAVSPASEVKGVELKFVGDLTKATLTEIGSKETLEVALTKGTALFEGVRAGTWSACQTGDLQAVAINLKTGASAGMVGALSAAGFAGGALAIAGNTGGSNGATETGTVASANRETLVYGGDDFVAPRAEEIVFEGPSAKNTGDCTLSMATVGGCRQDETPNPLSPFS